MFQFSESDHADVARLEALQTPQIKIIVHTGAGWVMKKWIPTNGLNFSTGCDVSAAYASFSSGGAEDADDYAVIAAKLKFPAYSLIGTINLLQLLLVLRQSDYFIGTDSGPRNMAHLADTRSVAILGPGPHFYMPWDTRDIELDASRPRTVSDVLFKKKMVSFIR